ncbi:hypothetical protein L6R52_04450 [Myxococcota bacterium]|nr:hypothetical protein [Myxococcota bacterium]
MSALSMAGLRPEQGPPLSVPLGFFVLGPLSVVVAGLLLVVTGGRDGGSAYSGFSLALVHLTTVGFLMMVMTGALYQMLPVVAGAAVPAPRLGHAVNGLLFAGALALAWGLVASEGKSFLVAFSLVLAALALFLVPAVLAVVRVRAESPTALGLRLALAGLAAVAGLGLTMAWARGTTGYTESWLVWRHAHAHLGLLGWVGLLVAAVSWQVVPMFFLASEVPRAAQRGILGAIVASMIALLAAFFFEFSENALVAAISPGAIAVWVVHPATTLRALAARRRKRRDPSVWFWTLSMALAPIVLVLDALAMWTDEPVFGPLFAFVALWGWAGAVVHGMTTRIVPFLVWLHRCSKWVGLRPNIPSARELYPDRHAALGFFAHVATLVLGVAAIALDLSITWRLLGAGLAATMVIILAGVLGALQRAPAEPR